MASTLKGNSGREYIKNAILRQYPKAPEFNIHRASCGGSLFVVKRVSESFFHLSKELEEEFRESKRLRIYIDCNKAEHTLIYDHYKNTLLGLLEKYPNFPPIEIKKILRYTGNAIKELYEKDWIYIVALGDFNLALKLVDQQPLRAPQAVGNAIWRSPEGQSGKGIAKPSDIFSFGLVCIYSLGGGPILILDNEIIQGLKDNGMPDVLYKSASEITDAEAVDDPDARFERWSRDIAPHLDSDAKKMILQMVNLDPLKRATIQEILHSSWW
ncbi:kinase-like domain-containing protein [Coniella lustricola]|uniref:Kinase-like domain-containing protein n=1 Tax=Coniella lustricola TaxID=2025994 RepID=A0A2T2ZTH8_9PEZI|nr:kinase-like domain-containing protein [Coniella lustricola]